MKNERIWELMARKMSGEASSEELEELDLILRTNPHLHFSVQAFADLWKHSSYRNLTESKQAYERHFEKMLEKGVQIGQPALKSDLDLLLLQGSRKSPRRKLLIMGLVVLFIVSGTGWWMSSRTPKTQTLSSATQELVNEISTRYGSKTRIQLPDGSQVWLNAGSKLNYAKDFGKEIREVQLIGEGFFDVVRNPQMPFVIHTSSVDIKVLGTQFNVKSYPGDKTTETSLVHGSVEVVVRKRPEQKYVLKPNEKIVVLNEDMVNLKPAQATKLKSVKEPIIVISPLTYKGSDSVATETEWTYNKLSFDDENFGEVAKKMERWYDVEFEFRNPKLEEVRIRGVLINETLPQAMEALKYANRFKYEIHGKNVIVY